MQDLTFDADAPILSPAQADRYEEVREQLSRLNAAVRDAVQAGLSVEIQRASRHHSGCGCWGDQMAPVLTRCQ